MFSKIFASVAQALDTSVFVVEFREGKAYLERGRVPPKFLSDLNEFVSEVGLRTGTIRGKRQETFTRLVFSPDVGTHLHQRLRNIWHIHEPTLRVS